MTSRVALKGEKSQASMVSRNRIFSRIWKVGILQMLVVLILVW